MTDEELLAIEARANEARPPYAEGVDVAVSQCDVPTLVAEVRRLRALPVIQVCGTCTFSTDAQGEPVAACHHAFAEHFEIDPDCAPPPECPLRRPAP